MALCCVPLYLCGHALLGPGIPILFVLRVDIRSRHLIFCKTGFEGTIKGGDVEQPEGAVDSSQSWMTGGSSFYLAD